MVKDAASFSSETSAVASPMDFFISSVRATPLPSLKCAPFSGAGASADEGLACVLPQLVSAAAMGINRIAKKIFMGVAS
jgi:hypothetical protein